ncbi:acyl-homoserine-lactone synthase [Bradyrhizobium japonicum]
MFELRHRVFKICMGWEVQTSDAMEIDEFDALHPSYLVQVFDDGKVQGAVRLLPTLGPTMLCDVFPALLEGQSAPSSPLVWESSRFAIDVAADAPKGDHGITRAAYELFAGMVEFATFPKAHRHSYGHRCPYGEILRRAGWPLRRIGNPSAIGKTLAVAGYLKISRETLASLRRASGLSTPVLWTPVISAAA